MRMPSTPISASEAIAIPIPSCDGVKLPLLLLHL